MQASVVVARRFNGPPASGNGGYVGGLLGEHVHGCSRTRLHAPPPLERALSLVTDGETCELRDDDVLVASCTRTSLPFEVPPAPTIDAARAATKRYVGFDSPIFATCFVCGHLRAEGDGLRIFPGAHEGLVAAPFTVPAELFGEDGGLAPPIVWAALDCSGYFAIVGDEQVPMLLGELAVEVRAKIPRGPLVSYGWSLGGEGRKARSGTAIASGDGDVLAVAFATWIRPIAAMK